VVDEHIDQEADESGIVTDLAKMNRAGVAVPALSMKTCGGGDAAREGNMDRLAPQLCTLPERTRMEHWAATVENIQRGLFKRAIEPKITPTYSTVVSKKLRATALKCCGESGPFSEQRIRAFASRIGEIGDLCPKSWSGERWERTFLETVQDTGLRVQPSIGIKDEVLEDAGKRKPRFIIADQDKGQAAAKFVIACFDELWYDWREGHHIKHCPKPEAMRKVRQTLSKGKGPPSVIVEGDGSAWDACCNARIRDDTENVVLYHIAKVLFDHPLFYEMLGDAHFDVCTKEKLKLRSKKGIKFVIDAIRRSGHAGTSGLNGFINAFLWSHVITNEPFKYLQGECVASKWHRPGFVEALLPAKDCFEGDDSILKLPRTLVQFEEDIEQQWREFGFRMKLFFRIDGVATFTGFDFTVEDGATSGLMVPSIRRNILSACFSVATEARLAWRDGDMAKLHDVGAQAFLARAVAFEDCCPPLANAFLCLAEYHFENSNAAPLPEDLVRHKGLELSFEDTAARVRASARPCGEAEIAFWAASAEDAAWGRKIPGLAALESLDAYSAHFMDIAA